MYIKKEDQCKLKDEIIGLKEKLRNLRDFENFKISPELKQKIKRYIKQEIINKK